MKLTNKQAGLIEHAFKKQIPLDINKALEEISSGKRKIKVPKTVIHIIDIKQSIQLTDHKFNQVACYFIEKYGLDFGMLYFTALFFGKRFYKNINKTKLIINNKWQIHNLKTDIQE